MIFNCEQWREIKGKYLMWDDLIMYAKIAWVRVIRLVKISAYSAEALLKALSKLGA